MPNQFLFAASHAYGLRTPWSFRSSLTDIVQIAKAAGYDGLYLELTKRFAAEVVSPECSDEVLDFIKAASQSPRSERSLKEVLKHSRPPLALALYVTMQERVASVETLLSLQKRCGNIPVVIYPHFENAEINGELRDEPDYPYRRSLSTTLVEPSPDLYAQWRVSNSDEFLSRLFEEKYAGVCLDLGHLIRPPSQGGKASDIEPPDKSLGILLPYTQMIHWRVFSPQEQFQAEGTALQQAKLDHMASLVKSTGWEGLIVPQVSVDQLGLFAKGTGPLMSVQRFIQAHQAMLEHLRSTFN